MAAKPNAPKVVDAATGEDVETKPKRTKKHHVLYTGDGTTLTDVVIFGEEVKALRGLAGKYRGYEYIDVEPGISLPAAIEAAKAEQR